MNIPKECRYCENRYVPQSGCHGDMEEPCENWEPERILVKYQNKRFKVVLDEYCEEILLEDNLKVLDTIDYTGSDYGLELAEERADFLNDLWQESQDIEDRFKSAILELLEKYFIQKHQQDNLVLGDMFEEKINVLEELLHEVGEDDMIVDFYEHMEDMVS